MKLKLRLKMTENIMDLNLYNLFDLESSASTKEIKTAFRKKALICHPDKNPDNSRAAELFRLLKNAVDILTDKRARLRYDLELEHRLQAEARRINLEFELEQLRKHFGSGKKAQKHSQTASPETTEYKLKAEIKKLEKEGSRKIEEEFLRKQIYFQLYGIKNSNDARVNIKWKAAKDDPENGGYYYENLYQILFKYGDIVGLAISSKNGRAIVEYRNTSDAVTVTQIEKGLLKNPLSLQGLWKSDRVLTSSETHESYLTKPTSSSLFPSIKSQNIIEHSLPSFSSAPNMFAMRPMKI